MQKTTIFGEKNNSYSIWEISEKSNLKDCVLCCKKCNAIFRIGIKKREVTYGIENLCKNCVTLFKKEDCIGFVGDGG